MIQRAPKGALEIFEQLAPIFQTHAQSKKTEWDEWIHATGLLDRVSVFDERLKSSQRRRARPNCTTRRKHSTKRHQSFDTHLFLVRLRAQKIVEA
jgi:hypothetical protein